MPIVLQLWKAGIGAKCSFTSICYNIKFEQILSWTTFWISALIFPNLLSNKGFKRYLDCGAKDFYRKELGSEREFRAKANFVQDKCCKLLPGSSIPLPLLCQHTLVSKFWNLLQKGYSSALVPQIVTHNVRWKMLKYATLEVYNVLIMLQQTSTWFVS